MDVYLNQFKAGTVAFTTVVTAEVTLLADEEAELTIRQDLFLASVSLIEALGGGWDTTLLPTPRGAAKVVLIIAATADTMNTDSVPRRESPAVFCPSP